MTKVKVAYETILVGSKRIRLKFWPSENGLKPDEALQYIGVLTRVKPEMMERVERDISKKYQIKGIFYPKP